MIHLASILALILTPLAAEKWVEIGREGGATMSLDMESIRPDGDLKYFRIRMTDSSRPDIAYGDLVADCKTATVEARHTEIVIDGKVTSPRDFAPGEARHEVNDDIGRALMKVVCG